MLVVLAGWGVPQSSSIQVFSISFWEVMIAGKGPWMVKPQINQWGCLKESSGEGNAEVATDPLIYG